MKKCKCAKHNIIGYLPPLETDMTLHFHIFVRKNRNISFICNEQESARYFVGAVLMVLCNIQVPCAIRHTNKICERVFWHNYIRWVSNTLYIEGDVPGCVSRIIQNEKIRCIKYAIGFYDSLSIF